MPSLQERVAMLPNLRLQGAQIATRNSARRRHSAISEPEFDLLPASTNMHVRRLVAVGTVEQKDPAAPPQDRGHGFPPLSLALDSTKPRPNEAFTAAFGHEARACHPRTLLLGSPAAHGGVVRRQVRQPSANKSNKEH
jgi:hypothetical protein